MTSKEIEKKLSDITENINPEEFIYDFLLAYGFPKSSITRLKKGDFNMTKADGEILYKGKLFFKSTDGVEMLAAVEDYARNEQILKHRPRFVMLTDFTDVVAQDIKTGAKITFPIHETSLHYAFFLPLTGAEIYKSTNDNKADREAAYELAKLYDFLVNDNEALFGGNSHNLNVFLSRLLFCFFAEDTGIFETPKIFTDTLANHTRRDGADVHIFLNDLFHKLSVRTGVFPSYVQPFPYVNGGLFAERIESPRFTYKSREILLNCGNLDWREINPDIFGSMIQAVADPEERSNLGMHYTSVPNILKLIRPLFLDELYEEFEKNRDNYRALKKLLLRMSKIKFFDPACGSGNFLIITYKELRLLEILIIKRLVEMDEERNDRQFYFTQIQLSQFYGIEIKDFAHEVARLSLWLAEHQMNTVFMDELMDYGRCEPILPLKEAGNITCANAATADWNQTCPRHTDDEIYVIGNPPYLGARMQGAEQKKDIENVFRHYKGYNNLDYISIWFYKGAKYIEGYNAQLAFVSTNSVCQGEQVALLWQIILIENIEISFAHTSFKWTNNAKGNAGVTVIILGIRNTAESLNRNFVKVGNLPKYLFTDNIRKEVKNINAYLLDSSDVYIIPRSKPLAKFPEMSFGSMPNDGGGLILNESEFEECKNRGIDLSCIKLFTGGFELLNKINRYCIWLNKDNYSKFLSVPFYADRLESVKTHRQNSNREATNVLAESFYSFGEIRHKETDAIIIPRVSSERRNYIPIGFLTSDTIIADSAMAIYDAQPWLFGVLHSRMHMVWVDAVGGKLKTDYRYSAKLCYNTFPFPEISVKQKELITQYVFGVLDERGKFPEKTMAWLYNPETMPSGLRRAHHELDMAIERCYRLTPFTNDAERLEYLFKMYDEMLRRDTLWAKGKRRK